LFLSEILGAYDNKYLILNKRILKTTINGNAKKHKEMHKNKRWGGGGLGVLEKLGCVCAG